MCLCAGCITACGANALTKCICGFCSLPGTRRAAKYVYGVLFLLVAVAVWVIRDMAYSLDLPALYTFSECKKKAYDRNWSPLADSSHCAGPEGVLRLSFGIFFFFTIMLVSTAGTKFREDWRDSWHVGWWPLKLLLFLFLLFLPFFIPSIFFEIYASICIGGSAIFLIIQLISLLNFVFVWNDTWLDMPDRMSWMITIAVVSYAISLAGIIAMYFFFAPHASCSLNIFLITFTLILIVIFSLISFHPSVTAGPMTSGLMGVYLVYLCWSAIMSQPFTQQCNTRPRQSGQGEWVDIIGLVIAIGSIALSVYATGIDSRCFALHPGGKDEDNPESNEVEYGYGFFHLVFALGSMYLAMLFIGWDLRSTQARWSVDSGWISMWVKLALEWLSAALYGWALVAPHILKNRDFS